MNTLSVARTSGTVLAVRFADIDLASDDNRVEYVTATNLPALEAMGQTVLREEEL